MTDKEFRFQCKRIKSLMAKWKGNCGLGQWVHTIIFLREPAPTHKMSDDDPDWPAVMSMESMWEYQTFTLTVSCPQLAGIPDWMLERMFIHELMHAALCILRDKEGYHRHEDFVATRLATSFQWMWGDAQKAKEKEMKKAAKSIK